MSNAMLQKIFHSEIYGRHPELQTDKDAMSKSEFIVLLLEMMNKVDEKDIVLASRVFNRLDVNGDGRYTYTYRQRGPCYPPFSSSSLL